MNNIYLSMFVFAMILLGGCESKHNSGSEHSNSHEQHLTDSNSHGHHTGVLETTSPISKDTFYYNEYVSQIHAYQHIELKALEKGYLQKVLVDEGQVVNKGQLLFEIQPTIYQAEIQKAKAEVALAEAEKDKIKVEYQNVKALADSNIISVNELALTEAELQKANANIENALAELALMEAHLKFTQIRAPFKGIIGRFEDIRLGSLLEEGEELTTLTDNSKMWVYFNLPEVEYLDYAQNNTMTQALDLELANGKLFEEKGMITAIEAEFDNTTGTIPFRATFSNPKRLLRHGQTGNVLWPVKLKDVMIIPQKATYEILEKRYVFVVDKQGKVSSREVEIAAELDDLYVISDGIGINERFLIEGIRKVKNGDVVEMLYKDPLEIYGHLELHAE